MRAVHLALLVFGLLAMAQQSTQLSMRDPQFMIVQGINDNAGPFIGVVSASKSVQNTLFKSGHFTPNAEKPYVDHAGRRFHVGTIKGVSVVCVIAGSPSVNAAMATQALVDLFRIQAIVHLGTAGSVNDAFNVGSVAIPKQVAFTSVWTWLPFGAKNASLQFGDYNRPRPGQNLLATVATETIDYYAPNNTVSDIYWIDVDSRSLKIASELKGLKLKKCVSGSNCLSKEPVVDVGLRGSTGDVYVNNEAYRGWVRRRFHASFVDEESAAVLLTGKSNGKPVTIIRGISNTAGGSNAFAAFSSLGRDNAVTTAVAFINLIKNPRITAYED